MKIFIGYDSTEDLAYKVCKFSILSRSEGVDIIPLKLSELIEKNVYTRDADINSTSEHTFSRFLVPYLTEYQGWVLYCDSDMLFLDNVKELFKMTNDKYAVMVVKHDYTPSKTLKKNGKEQKIYPRKNWSSLMLWNCSHPANRRLGLETVNNKTGEWLQKFSWLRPEEIGDINKEWNWLVNWYKEPIDGTPRVLHFTEGGPWYEECVKTEYGFVWEREKQKYLERKTTQEKPAGPFDYIPNDIKNLFLNILKYRVDPNGEYYGQTYEVVSEELKMLDNKKLFAVDGGRNPDEYKGLGYDPYMESFILGSGGQITNYDKVAEHKTPVVFRGITKAKHMRACEAAGRDYYYIDTGYFGNVRKKLYHRITKNAMQNIGPILERPFDRLSATGWQKRKFRGGKNILICPPSAKAMACFGQDLDLWMKETIETIKKYTDRPIVIRQKLSRRERVGDDTIEAALLRDVHCMVTYNSIAASEALLLGKPAFTLGPNAAHSLSLDDLTKIETPYIPSFDELEAWAAHLAYCQFTEYEMKDGTAFRILNDDANIWEPESEEEIDDDA
jgi:lipopolysaccharide biosynthesis glycosyltransferase